MEIGSINSGSQEVIEFLQITVEWSSKETFPHKPLEVVTIWRKYISICAILVYSDFERTHVVQDTMTKTNVSSDNPTLPFIKKKTRNGIGLKRELEEYSISNISAYVSEII
jgi:hypothetical protein